MASILNTTGVNVDPFTVALQQKARMESIAAQKLQQQAQTLAMQQAQQLLPYRIDQMKSTRDLTDAQADKANQESKIIATQELIRQQNAENAAKALNYRKLSSVMRYINSNPDYRTFINSKYPQLQGLISKAILTGDTTPDLMNIVTSLGLPEDTSTPMAGDNQGVPTQIPNNLPSSTQPTAIQPQPTTPLDGSQPLAQYTNGLKQVSQLSGQNVPLSQIAANRILKQNMPVKQQNTLYALSKSTAILDYLNQLADQSHPIFGALGQVNDFLHQNLLNSLGITSQTDMKYQDLLRSAHAAANMINSYYGGSITPSQVQQIQALVVPKKGDSYDVYKDRLRSARDLLEREASIGNRTVTELAYDPLGMRTAAAGVPQPDDYINPIGQQKVPQSVDILGKILKNRNIK